MSSNWRSWMWKLWMAIWLAVSGATIIPCGKYVLAQVIPDGTLGDENSRVANDVNVRGALADLIEGGANRDGNLFHSFEEFNVKELQRVYFANPAGIENILSRVTGSNLSEILGILGVDGGANLFLLNPNGIIFGSNARLDVAGSFLATTADGIKLGEDGLFSASNPQSSNLLAVQPGALFSNALRNHQAQINNKGMLATGQNLTLAADNLDLQGQLLAGGDLNLLATNTVKIRDTVAQPFIAASGGNLLVQGNQRVDIFALNNSNSGLFPFGDLVLRSDFDVIGDAHFWSGGSFPIERLDGSLGSLFSEYDPVIQTQGDVSFSGYQGSSLHILAGGSVDINTVIITGPDTVGDSINPTATPDLANVTLSDGTSLVINGNEKVTLDIRAGVAPTVISNQFITGEIFPFPNFDFSLLGFNLLIEPFSFPVSASSADITIGDVFMLPPDGTVLLTNQYKPNTSVTGGNITVTGVGVFGIGGINARGKGGNGSDVILDSRGNLTLDGIIDASGVDNNGVFNGNGGEIKLGAQGNITLNPGASIFSDGLLGGNITLNSQANISIIDGRIISGNFTTTLAESSQTGGDIKLIARSLSVTNGAQLAAITFGVEDAGSIKIEAIETVVFDGEDKDGNNSGAFSQVTPGAEGKAGDVTITTGSLYVTNGAQLNASTSGVGDAGSVTIEATDKVVFDEEDLDGFPSGALSRVNRRETKGNAGGVTITTRSLEVTNGAVISASTFGEGNAGSVTIKATDSIVFDGHFSGAFSQVNSGAKGNAGGVTITTGSLEVNNGAQINASTFGEGSAGSINIEATETVIFDGEDEDGFPSGALSKVFPGARGNAGGVTITTGSLYVTNGAQLDAGTNAEGNAGSVKIEATDKVVFDGEDKDGFNSGAFSSVDSGAKGNAGGVTISTGSLYVTNGAQLDAGTFGEGSAGSINIEATEKVVFDGEGKDEFSSGAFSRVNSGVEGKEGGITITTGSLEVTNNAQISASTFGEGNAGGVTIEASEKVVFDGQFSGAFSSVDSGAKGNAGGVTIINRRWKSRKLTN
ncbi:MAG: filamentous hemagglutinin N-terminal domain-containing protein [Moorea sp. SIO2B7]|nr:filamentous hemagglutinin N-terminal domain-containing protein [Moorena sp. SIO2B7]